MTTKDDDDDDKTMHLLVEEDVQEILSRRSEATSISTEIAEEDEIKRVKAVESGDIVLWFVDSQDVEVQSMFSDEKSPAKAYVTLRTTKSAADLVFTIKKIQRRTSWFTARKTSTSSSLHIAHVKKSVCETIRTIRNLLQDVLTTSAHQKHIKSESLNDFVVEARYALRYVWDRPDIDVTNDTTLKSILENIRRLSRKVQTDGHVIISLTTPTKKSTTTTKSIIKGIAVSKEAHRIDEKVRQMRINDDSTDHKVAVGRADFISFTQYGPVGKTAISDLAILLLCDWTSSPKESFDPELIESLRRAGRVVLIRWPFHKSSSRNKSTSGVFTEKYSYPLLVSAAVRVIRSLRKFKGINLVVPFCQGHAGWIGVRLLRSLPRVLPGVVFSNWNLVRENLSREEENKYENKKITHEISRSYSVFKSPLKSMMTSKTVRVLNTISSTTQKIIQEEEEEEEKEQKNEDESDSEDDLLEEIEYDWLTRTKFKNNKEHGEQVCVFIQSLPLPPLPPRKPVWNAKTCVMSWTVPKSRKQRTTPTTDDEEEDVIQSLHFFLVPSVKEAKIPQSIVENELDAAIDEGRPNRSVQYLISRGLLGSVAMYGAALLVSAPIVLTATALYGAKRALNRKKEEVEEVEKIEEIVPIEPSLTIRPCPKCKVKLTRRLLDIFEETSKWPLLPDRTYAVCASTLSDIISNKSPFGARLMWTCPLKPSKVVNVKEDQGMLSWDSVDDDVTVLYELRFGFDSWIDRKWYYVKSIVGTEKRLSNLTPRATYVAEIRAISPGGFGEWSDRVKFIAADRDILKDHDDVDDDDDDDDTSSDEEGTVTVIEYTEA